MSPRSSRARNSRADLRRLNRSRILEHLARLGPLSRTRLVELTGLTSGAVSRITAELIEAGILEEGEAPPSKGKVGPRFIALDVASGGGYLLGLGLEASSQEIAIANLRGAIVARRCLQLRQLDDPRSVAREIAQEASKFIADERVPVDRIFGFGAAVIGVVDPERGVVLESPYLKWKDVPFGRHLHDATALPVYTDGLLHSLNLAEVSESSRLSQANVIYVHTTLGLGTSILAEGVLLRGEARAAGQIGHIRVTIPVEGRLHPLPLAELSSGRAVLASLGHASNGQHHHEGFAEDLRRLRDVLELGLSPQSKEAAALRSAGEHLGEYLGGLCGVLNPKRITLGGVLGRHPEYVEGVKEGISHQNFVPTNYSPELTISDMDSARAGAILARNQALLIDGFDLPPFERFDI